MVGVDWGEFVKKGFVKEGEGVDESIAVRRDGMDES